VCGIHDEAGGFDDLKWCYDCWENKTEQTKAQRKKPPSDATNLDTEKQKKKRATTQKSRGVLKKATSTTMTRVLKKATSTMTRGVPNDKVKTRQAAKGKLSSTRCTKSLPTRLRNLKNKLVIPKEASNVDPFCG
jgi:hypothetical protein